MKGIRADDPGHRMCDIHRKQGDPVNSDTEGVGGWTMKKNTTKQQ